MRCAASAARWCRVSAWVAMNVKLLRYDCRGTSTGTEREIVSHLTQGISVSLDSSRSRSAWKSARLETAKVSVGNTEPILVGGRTRVRPPTKSRENAGNCGESDYLSRRNCPKSFSERGAREEHHERGYSWWPEEWLNLLVARNPKMGAL